MRDPLPQTARFAGFRKEAFTFLTELDAEQNRAWFETHRGLYEATVRIPMTALVAALGPELERLKIPLQSDPRRAIFRVHRDVRFSRDKRPFKTHHRRLCRTGRAAVR